MVCRDVGCGVWGVVCWVWGVVCGVWYVLCGVCGRIRVEHGKPRCDLLLQQRDLSAFTRAVAPAA